MLLIAAFIFMSVRSSQKKRALTPEIYLQPASSPVVAGAPHALSLLDRFPPITTALIAASVAISLLSSFGASTAALSPFFIADPGSAGFQDIVSGQVWRLITPIFIHFGVMHILFNMMWLWDLGGIIERKKGRPFFVGFILLLGIASNLAQYTIEGSPFFGGMSGVVYGLLGYMWISGRRNPQSGFALHQQTVIMMFGWYVLCWTGFFGPIANWAHTVGLVIGIAAGYRKQNNI